MALQGYCANGEWHKVKDREKNFPGGPRLDAAAKVTGREKYSADLYSGKFLWAGVKRAHIPHARLGTIHAEGALTLPGVRRVLTHRDVAGKNRVGLAKNDQPVLVDAALNAGGVPVKMWWDRAESFLAGVKRLPARMYYRLGAKKDGTFHGLVSRLYYDAGAYAGLSGEIMAMGMEHAGSAYLIPNITVEGRCVYTNNPLGGPFRGFGVPQVTFAMEQTVDMIAEKLSMDPLEVRRKNALKAGDINCLGVELKYSTGIGECIGHLMEHPFWKERQAWKRAAPKWKKRGTGVGCMGHAVGYPALVPDQANAMLELKKDGAIRLYSSLPDMGQGNASTYLRIASAILDQDAATMELVQPDTDHGLPSGSSSASRTTCVFGNAVIDAARSLRETILGCAAGVFGSTDANGLTLLPGKVRDMTSGREVPLADIARILGDDERSRKGFFRAPYDESTVDIFYLGAHVLFSYGAHLARIEIDTLTGAIEVKDYLAVTDAGAVIDRGGYDQQVQGSVAQGIGYALMEDYAAPGGMHATQGLSTYIIPTSLDLPDVVSVPVESFEATGPFGMKGIGEVVISGSLPAISNAVYDACSVRMTRAPLTQERVLPVTAGKRGGE